MKHIRFGILVIVLCVAALACRDNDDRLFEHETLIKAGDTVILVSDYMKALEISKASFPHHMLRNQEKFKAIKTRLLAQMMEELVIMKVAKEKNIVVSDEEFNKEVADIKKDFPEGEFENMLVENVISNRLWEERLRKRMLMEKVLDQEFNSKINIDSNDLKKYYEENQDTIQSELQGENDEKEVYDRLIRRMKMEKKQAAYQAWIIQKNKDYSIEVNQKIWEKILEL